MAFAKGPLGGNNVDEVLERVNSSFSALQKCVDNIKDEKASGTYSTTQRIEREAKAIRLNTKNTEVGVESVATKMSNLEDNVGSLAKEVRDSYQRISDENSRSNTLGVDARNGLFDLLKAEMRNFIANQVFASHDPKKPSFPIFVSFALRTCSVPNGSRVSPGCKQ